MVGISAVLVAASMYLLLAYDRFELEKTKERRTMDVSMVVVGVASLLVILVFRLLWLLLCRGRGGVVTNLPCMVLSTLLFRSHTEPCLVVLSHPTFHVSRSSSGKAFHAFETNLDTSVVLIVCPSSFVCL